MYHIWPGECQIQFSTAEHAQNRKFAVEITTAGGGSEFGDAVRRGLGRVNQGDDVIARECPLNLGEARDRGPGLSGQRQRRERGFGEAFLDAAGKIRLDLDRAAVGAGEKAPPFGRFDVVRPRGYPDPAAR